MISKNIYNQWTDFINNFKYNAYFLDNVDIWYNSLEKVNKEWLPFFEEKEASPSLYCEQLPKTILHRLVKYERVAFYS
jgi:hypothetical protein